MAYTNEWDEAKPDGTEQANTLDNIIQNLKKAVRERMNELLHADSQWEEDSEQPKKIKWSSIKDPPVIPAATVARTDTEINTLITAAINALVDGAPGALDTLNEIAAALGDDEVFTTSVANSLANKLTTAQATALIATWARAANPSGKIPSDLLPDSTGEVNVQANWGEADDTEDAFILNKPTVITAAERRRIPAINPGNEKVWKTSDMGIPGWRDDEGVLGGAAGEGFEPTVLYASADVSGNWQELTLTEDLALGYIVSFQLAHKGSGGRSFVLATSNAILSTTEIDAAPSNYNNALVVKIAQTSVPGFGHDSMIIRKSDEANKLWVRTGRGAAENWSIIAYKQRVGLPGTASKATDADVDAEINDAKYVTIAKIFRAIKRKVKFASSTVRGIVILARDVDVDSTETDTARVPTVARAKRLINRLIPAAAVLRIPAADPGNSKVWKTSDTGTPGWRDAGSGGGQTASQVNTLIGAAVDNLLDGAPDALNTLNELAAALADDAMYSTTLTTALSKKITSAQGTALIATWALASGASGKAPKDSVAGSRTINEL